MPVLRYQYILAVLRDWTMRRLPPLDAAMWYHEAPQPTNLHRYRYTWFGNHVWPSLQAQLWHGIDWQAP